MNLPIVTCGALLTVWTIPLWCQSASVQSTRDSSQVLVLDHDFTGPHEMVRVFLQDGQVYRAEIGSPNVTLEIRGVVRTIQAPHVYPFLPSQTPSGSTFLEIYPEKDAEYEIRSLGIGGTRLPTRLRLYRDVGASARRQYVRASRGWGIGLELAGGWHSGFVQSGGVPPAGTDPAGGMDLEGCFTARGSASSSRFSLCVLGVGHQSQHGSRSILWVYTEPRFRLVGSGGARGTGWELGPLFRFGLGMISASPETPVLIAPGAYITRFIRTSSRTGGWSLQAAYSHPFYKGFARPTGAEPATPHGHRLSFGVGWYR
ncbi:MAG TPA: hypothetical protein VFZ87_02390 [Gemmatimonadales bacterium]